MGNITSDQLTIVTSIINPIITILGVFIGFALGYYGNLLRDKTKKKEDRSQLIRSLHQEVSSNLIKCRIISLGGSVGGYFETVSWDRIRYSDTLYYCISMRNQDIYNQILKVYNAVAALNWGIGRFQVALDNDTRNANNHSGNILSLTRKLLSDEAKVTVSDLESLEANLRQFLIKEGYFSAVDKR